MIEEERHRRGDNPLSDIWTYLRDHDDDITELKTGLAELRTGQGNTNAKLDSVVSSLGRMESFIHKPAPRPNYTGWVAAGVAVLALFGSLILAFVRPMQNDIVNLKESRTVSYAAGQDEAYSHGRRDERLDSLDRRIETIEDIIQRARRQ